MSGYPELLSDSAGWAEFKRGRNKLIPKWLLVVYMLVAFPFWLIHVIAEDFEFICDELDRRRR